MIRLLPVVVLIPTVVLKETKVFILFYDYNDALISKGLKKCIMYY